MVKDLNSLAIEMQSRTIRERLEAQTVPEAGTRSDRGFTYIRWRDQCWQECRLSESSGEGTRVWLGETHDCILLSQRQAEALAKLLLHFSEHGSLPVQGE